MNLTFEIELEEDGRWIAEVPELPGVLAYGISRDDAMAKAEALALRVLAERIEHGEARPMSLSISIAAERAVLQQPKLAVYWPRCCDLGGGSSGSQDHIGRSSETAGPMSCSRSMIVMRLGLPCLPASANEPD